MFSLVSGKLFQGRITLRAKIFPCITYWEDEVCNGGHGYNADTGTGVKENVTSTSILPLKILSAYVSVPAWSVPVVLTWVLVLPRDAMHARY